MAKWMICLGLSVASMLAGLTGASAAATTGDVTPGVLTTGIVTAVEDGAHISVQVNGQARRVTLIGVDVSEPGACEGRGTPYLRSLVLGRRVRLEGDRKPFAQDASLAYVYLPDGTFANERMILNGFARLGVLGTHMAHAGEFVTAQNIARSRHLCVWVGTRPVYTGYAHQPRRIPLPAAVRRTRPAGGGGGFGRIMPTPPPGFRPPKPPNWRPLPVPKP
jgi:endonuclease YncB( thermonuclease family)